jgi:hypothetical protein
MSWDQGVHVREELPEAFVKWADAKKGARFEYVTWFGNSAPVILDFGEAGALDVALTPDRFFALLHGLSDERETRPR